jgi:adenylate cyclase
VSNINFSLKAKIKLKMATEIERKFLVKGEFKSRSVKEVEILQKYLTIDPLKSIRLRITGDEAILSIKNRIEKGSISRNEWEYSIPLADAEELMKLCLPGKIVKTRYLVPSGKHIFEVDVFHDKNEGLIIAEIELQSEDETFEKPDWLGEEVSGKHQYFNTSLIKD